MLLYVIILSSSLFSISAASSYTIDFRKLYTLESKENISASELMSFLNSEDGSPGIIIGVPECNNAYGYSNGLKAERAYDKATVSLTDYGALFIRSTDPVTKTDNGGVTLRIDPKYRHRNTNLNIYVYLDELSTSNQDLSPQLEVSFNGGPFQKSNFIKKGQNYTGSFNYKPEGTIISELTIRLPNIYRKEGTELSDGSLDYYMAITHLNLYYGDDSSEEVTDWKFSKSEDTGYVYGASSYVMPELISIPTEAASMIELSTSDPLVAEISEGKVVPIKEGVAIITATLAENNLFKPSASYSPASYALTVKEAPSTVVELTYNRDIEETRIYDLSGREVKGAILPGLYIVKSGSDVKKILLK